MLSTNFAFLEKKFPEWYKRAVQAEDHLWDDPETTGSKIRILIEEILNSTFANVGLSATSLERIEEKINYLDKMEVLPVWVKDAFHKVRQIGNKAVHPDPITTAEARIGLENLQIVAAWYYLTYVDGKYSAPEFQPYVFRDSNAVASKKKPNQKQKQDQVEWIDLPSSRDEAESDSSDKAPCSLHDEQTAGNLRPDQAPEMSKTVEPIDPQATDAKPDNDGTARGPGPVIDGSLAIQKVPSGQNDAAREIYRILDDARRIVTQEHRDAKAFDLATIELDKAVAIATEPYRLAVLGAFKAGKSTLINSMAGAKIAFTDSLCATCIPTGYIFSSRPQAEIEYTSGHVAEMSLEGFLAIVQEKRDDLNWVASVRCARVGYPSGFLRVIEPWDVPGIGGSETDEQKAFDFMDRVGGAIWVFDATKLGDVAVNEPIRHLHLKGVRMIAALNMIDRVDEQEITDLVGFVEESYEGAFISVSPVSAAQPDLKDRAYLSALIHTIQTELVASSDGDRQMRANLAMANAAQYAERVLEREKGFHSAFIGFVRHIHKNLNERRTFLLSQVPAWISDESWKALQPIENKAISELAGGYDSIEKAYEVLQQQESIQTAWKNAHRAVADRAISLWKSLWMESVSLSLDSVPSVQLTVPNQEPSPEIKSLEERAVMDGVAAGGKAAAVAGVVAAALYIIHWPVIFVGLPIGLLEWWRRRSALRASFSIKEEENRLRKSVQEFRSQFAQSLEQEIRQLIEVQTEEAMTATIHGFVDENFGGITIDGIRKNEERYNDHIKVLKTVRVQIWSQYGIEEPEDWTARPLIITPNNIGGAKWAHFLTADLQTVDMIVQNYWIPTGPVLGHLAPGTRVRILTTCREPEWESASRHLRGQIEKWNGECEIRVLAAENGDALSLSDTWIITNSEALICHDSLEAIGQRTCVFDSYHDGAFAAQSDFAELWQARGKNGQHLKLLMVR